MKKRTILFYAVMIICLSSCRWYDHGNIDISYSEWSHYYLMKAHFNRHKTRAVEEYMNDRIGDRGDMSFVNTRIDGQITLDDRTTFYIKKYPGFLEIKLDKDQNDFDSYQRVK